MIKNIIGIISNKTFLNYFYNTLYLMFDKIFKIIFGSLIIILLTRYLGPEKFGVLSYSQSFIGIFLSFASLGLSQILIRDIVKDRENENIFLGTAAVLMLSASLVSILAVFLINYIVMDTEKEYDVFWITIILSLTIIFNILYIVSESYFQAIVASKYIVYVNTSVFIVSAVVKLLLIYVKAPLLWFGVNILIDSVLVSFICCYFLKKYKVSFLNWKFDSDVAKKYLKNCLPLVMIAVTAFLYSRVDQILLKFMLGDKEVGLYSAAIRLSELSFFIPGAIASSIYPKLVELSQKDNDKYLNILENTYRVSAWISILIALFIFFSSKFLVSILYGEEFKESYLMLSILCFAIIPASINSIFVKVLYINKFEKKYLCINIFGVIMNILFNLILIKQFGVYGACISNVVTVFSIVYVYDLFDKDLRKIYYLKVLCFMPKINLKRYL